MKRVIAFFISLLFLPTLAPAQSTAVQGMNKTDEGGKKQGSWIKYDNDGNIVYEGTFKDDHPVGKFIRYNEDKSVKSILYYSDNGREAAATIFYPNGFIASEGKYIDQMKEGRWKFFSRSISDYLICEEEYTGNIRNGPSVKYYADSTIAEKICYLNGVKSGEWLQYYANGNLFLKSYYSGGMLNGLFEVWYPDGKPYYRGTYMNNLREGTWLIFNEDETIKYRLDYESGITNDLQMEREASNFIDSLEKNRWKVAGPEKTGTLY
jgi:antitoxin component YwqK of YwqJK toxin-antitoxin module